MFCVFVPGFVSFKRSQKKGLPIGWGDIRQKMSLIVGFHQVSPVSVSSDGKSF